MNNHQRFHVSSHCTPYLVLYTRKCIGCWQCLAVCSRQVLGSVRFLWHRHVVVKTEWIVLDVRNVCKCVLNRFL